MTLKHTAGAAPEQYEAGLPRQVLPQRPFVFMRHGQTELNAAGLICGRMDPPLDEAGRQQALAAGKVLAELPFSCVAVSSAQRAIETAALALPGQAMLVFDGLRERDWGELEGRPLAEQCGYTETPPGGEPWQVFLDRVATTLACILEQHEQPLVVAHSGVWRALRALASGTPDGPRVANAAPVLVVPAVALAALSERAGSRSVETGLSLAGGRWNIAAGFELIPTFVL